MHDFSKEEIKLYRKLNTPAKVQNFLEKIPANFKETCYSPRLVLRRREADCFEGALFAAAALEFHGYKPLVVDLNANKTDYDHAIAVFKIGGYFGAISKTNHAVLRYREPVYKSIRELVMSYFHEYFIDSGEKTLRSYSNPVDLSRFDARKWITSDKELWYIDKYLNRVKHFPILTAGQIKSLRPADPVEIKTGKIKQW